MDMFFVLFKLEMEIMSVPMIMELLKYGIREQIEVWEQQKDILIGFIVYLNYKMV